MNCHVCGAKLRAAVTDLPFKTNERSIVIVKGLPVLQCDNCREFLIEDPVMERVESVLAKADADVELEIVRYAA